MYHAAAAPCIRTEAKAAYHSSAEDAKLVKSGLFDAHFTRDDNSPPSDPIAYNFSACS